MHKKKSISLLKRFKFSSKGKIRRRSVGINHFNAKDNGSTRRHHRHEKPLAKSNLKDIKNLMPYNVGIL